MTVKKAIKIIDWWINEREESIQKLETDFNFNDPEIPKVLLNNEKVIIENLKLIRKELVH